MNVNLGVYTGDFYAVFTAVLNSKLPAFFAPLAWHLHGDFIAILKCCPVMRSQPMRCKNKTAQRSLVVPQGKFFADIAPMHNIPKWQSSPREITAKIAGSLHR